MNKKSLLEFGIIGIAGLAVFLGLYERVFPQASIRYDLTFAQAQKFATKYLEKHGHDVADYKSATVFDIDQMATVYLQRTWGIDRFNKELSAHPELAPWMYSSRFFKPLQKEEFVVGIDANAEIIGFRRQIEEEQAGASLTKEQARVRLEEFVRDTLAIDLGLYEEKEYRDTKRPNRVDHFFDYELKGSAVGERISFTLQGDRVDGFRRHIFVPEEFVRTQEKTDSSGMLYYYIAFLAMVMLFIGAVVILIRRYKTGNAQFRAFSKITIVMAIVAVATMASDTSTLWYHYPTTTPSSTFLITAMIFAFFSILIMSIELFVTGVSGESLTREQFPAANDMQAGSAWPGRELMMKTYKGICAGLAILGYITLFYLISERFFEIWSPIAPNIAGMNDSILPFLVPIFFSLSAALTEEISFRFFGVSFLKRFVKHTWIAVLIPGIIWAFLHSTYAVYPMHIRGIELTIGALILTYFFLRHGIFVAIIAHFTINIILFSMPLLQSSHQWLFISGIIALLSTFFLPLLLHWARTSKMIRTL